MKLADLKQGMVCELRNGNPFTVSNTNAGRKFYNDRSNAFFKLSDNYNDDLTHQVQKDYDIMKVTFGNDVIYERPKSNLFFEPKENEYYYYIDSTGLVSYQNTGNFGVNIFKSHMVYKTIEEADKELLRQQARIRVIKEIARLNDGWDVREHWGSFDTWKFYIMYNYRTSVLMVNSASNFKTLDNNLYLKTRELGEQLIETHSDDLKLMLEVE